MNSSVTPRLLVQSTFGPGIGLSQYTDRLAGWDVASLKRLDRGELEHVAREAGVKAGHKCKFVEYMLSPQRVPA